MNGAQCVNGLQRCVHGLGVIFRFAIRPELLHHKPTEPSVRSVNSFTTKLGSFASFTYTLHLAVDEDHFGVKPLVAIRCRLDAFFILAGPFLAQPAPRPLRMRHILHVMHLLFRVFRAEIERSGLPARIMSHLREKHRCFA